MALRVTDNNDGLETGTLTGTSLLLDGLDLYGGQWLEGGRKQCGFFWHCAHLHNLVLELGEEEVDNLELLDREGVQVNLLHALDLASLDKTAQLGDRLPLLLVVLVPTTASTTTTATTTATVTTTIAARRKAAAAGGSTSSSISHICKYFGEECIVAVVNWSSAAVWSVIFKVGSFLQRNSGFLVCQAPTLKKFRHLECQAGSSAGQRPTSGARPIALT